MDERLDMDPYTQKQFGTWEYLLRLIITQKGSKHVGTYAIFVLKEIMLTKW
jgi:hypothetical protein